VTDLDIIVPFVLGALMNEVLKEVTDDTLKTIRSLEIVLPRVYEDIFTSIAKKHGIDIESIDIQDALDYALEKFTTVSTKTKESTNELHTHVENAQKAFKNKDTKTLETISKDLKILKTKISRLQEEVFLDSLTKLYNRRWLYEEFLNDDFFTCKGALAFLDLDDFKSVNDNYGHQTGDKVLIVIAQVLKKLENALLVRFAGDEFIVILPNGSKYTLDRALGTIQKNLKDTPLKTGRNTFHIGFSYGVSSFEPYDDFNTIYSKVDAKMYAAKSSKPHYQESLKM
jgi:diguanylate cyclase (GGDEF)-like protein